MNRFHAFLVLVLFPLVAKAQFTVSPSILNVAVDSVTEITYAGAPAPYPVYSNATNGTVYKGTDGKFYYKAPSAPLRDINIRLYLNSTVYALLTTNIYPKLVATQTQPYSVTARTGFTLRPEGGKPPYNFYIHSGIGTIDAVSGLYTAPDKTGSAVIKVTDGSRQTLLVNVDVPKMYISNRSVTVDGNSTTTFYINGGVSPFTLSKKYGGTLSESNRTITYTAPVTGHTDEVITITDAERQTYTINVSVRAVNPVISRFNSDKASVSAGESARLSWAVSNSTSLILNPGNINVTGKQFHDVSPTATTTYSLKAINGSLSVTSTAQVTFSNRAVGNFIPSKYAPNCTPQEFNDFMDNMSWTNRRVEPRDCALVNISTPVFHWVLPLDKSTNTNTHNMTLKIKRLSDGFIHTYRTLTPRYIAPVLQNGKYEWTVEYLNRAGDRIIVSSPRRFEVQNTKNLAIPQADAVLEVVKSKPHPRAVPVNFEIGDHEQRMNNGEYKIAYGAFITSANNSLNQAPPAVPVFNGYVQTRDEYNMMLMKITAAERKAIENLGYAYYFTKNTAYATKGIERLMSLAAWPADYETSDTSEKNQDQANREIYLALAHGIDLFYTDLGPTRRTQIIATFRNRINQAMAGYLRDVSTDQFVNLDRNPYDSHKLTAVQYAAQALMYMVNVSEYAEGNQRFKDTWVALITSAGSWGGYDGGFGGGTAYGWYAMGSNASLLAAVRLITGVDLSKWDVIGRIGYNQIAQTPADTYLRGQFGDNTEFNDHYRGHTYDAFRLLALITQNPHYAWYWRYLEWNTRANTPLEPLSPFHFLLSASYTGIIPTFPLQGLENEFVFEDAGYAAFHTDSRDPLRSSVFFRSSRLGAENHSHGDNNGLTFVSKGKEILISAGYYDSYGSKHHRRVTKATRHKNALTFDGGIGQAETVTNAQPTPVSGEIRDIAYRGDFRGKLTNFVVSPDWAIISGDATKAYRTWNKDTAEIKPLLSSALRTVAYNRAAGVVVIYDRATSATARQWELNFQSLARPVVDNSKNFKITNGTSSACFNLYTTGAGTITTSSDFAEPINKAAHFRTFHQTSNKTNKFVSITVIRESCAAQTIPVPTMDIETGRATIKVNNKTLIFDNGAVEY